MKHFSLKRSINFKYCYFVHEKIKKLKKKKWVVYTRFNYPYYIGTKRFYRYDFVKIQKFLKILKKNYKNQFLMKQWLKQICGGLKNKDLKNSLLKKNPPFFLESRLDITITQTGLIDNILKVQQIINHNKVFVNGKKIKSSHFKLKRGDVVDLKLTTFELAKTRVFISPHLEVSNKLTSFIFVGSNPKNFFTFSLKDLAFYKIYLFFLNHRKN